MPNFTPIKNSLLRSLVIASDAITSLPGDEIQEMIDGIAKMSEKGQEELIKLLEDEQYETQRRQRLLNAAYDAADSAARTVKSSMRTFSRANEAGKSEKAAEKLIENI